jgi:hypothetical protein
LIPVASDPEVTERRGGAMRKNVLTVVGVVCALGVAGGTLVANAGADITAPEKITVLGTTTKDRFVDVGKPGPTPGDTFMWVEQLSDESDDSVVGKARIECTMHIGSWAICTGTFDITGRGEIVGQGMVPMTEEGTPFDVPVTGGTAEFANVRGVVHVEPISEAEERHTLDLIP